MKLNHTVLLVVFLILASLTGMMAMNGVILDQQAALESSQTEKDRLLAAAYWRRIASYRPHSPPLDFLAMSSGVGYRLDPMGGGTEALHKGIDFAAPEGTPVKAVLAGTVVEHWLVPGTVRNGIRYKGHSVFGGFIVLDHGGGLLSLYGHLSETEVYTGQWVEMGQVIGRVGNTGISTAPHLHFELVIDGLKYLEGKR